MIRIREISGPDDPTLKPAYALLKRTFHASERVTLRDEGIEITWRESGWHALAGEMRPGTIGAELLLSLIHISEPTRPY